MDNQQILASRLTEFNKVSGPRVGDFIKLPRIHKHHPEYTRITEDLGNWLQTGGTAGGSYYIYGVGLSYSGSLDRGISRAQLIETKEIKQGSVWFFSEGQVGAGRGVTFDAAMRVFAVQDGADIAGLGELRCPYSVSCLDASYYDMHGYWYLVTKNGQSETGFNTISELNKWVLQHDLVLTEPLPPGKTRAHIKLLYTEEAARMLNKRNK